MSDFEIQSAELFREFARQLGKVDLSRAVGLADATSQLLNQDVRAEIESRVPALFGPSSISLQRGNDVSSSLERALLALTGANKTYVPPDYAGGRYAGLVLGETERHVLVGVDGRANTATALDKSRLGATKFGIGEVLKVQFRGGLAVQPGLSKVKSRSL